MDFLRGFAAFLDHRYWLNPTPVALGPSLVSGIFSFFAWFIVIGVGLAIGAHWVRKTHPRRTGLLRKFARLLTWTGVFGLLCLFFSYEQLPLLGMRLWFLVTVLYFLIRLGYVIWYLVRDYPRERREEEERRRIEKYLPHKK